MPGTVVEPYLYFGGRCEEALNFYKNAIGAKIEAMMKFSDSPEPMPAGMLPPGYEHKVMHSCVSIGGSKVMASDGCKPGGSMEGFSLSLTVGNEAEAHRAFDALGKGGQVQMPLAKTFWSPCFGMVKDPFGVAWMVMVMGEECPQ
jgi:PhnB protein